jgi:DNA-binding NtrC family response regulator
MTSHAPRVVLLHAEDRSWRTAIDRALREAGMTVRSSSRAAELAKALADGTAAVVIAGPAPDDVAAVRRACAASGRVVPMVQMGPDDTTVAVVHRALALIQPTSSA